MVQGESSQPPPIEHSKTALQCPMLTSTNYNIWAIRVKAVFRVHGILDALEPKEGTQVVDKQDHMAVALLFQAIPEELVFQVSQFNTAKEIWEALKTRYVGVDRVREARLQTLETEFESLKMKVNESVDDFAARLGKIVTEVNSLGTVYEDKKLVKKLLASVPDRYVAIVASIEQFTDLNIMSF